MNNYKNNFTTPEQSKRLLELGVPADSADCYYSQTCRTIVITDEQINKKEFYKVILPIWSVGRLIEILCTCKKGEEVSFYTWTDKVDLVEWIIYKIEEAEPDFSKLED